MALINYVEPTNIGSVFTGIGALLVSIVLAYCIFRLFMILTDFLKILYNRQSKYELLEGSFLDSIAAKKGIDLNKELAKRNIISPINKKTKSFRKKLEEQIYEEMFGKQEKDKEESK